jgi:ATP-dependent protease ClpP protease subunit
VSRLTVLAGAGCIWALWSSFQSPSNSRDVASRQILSISEEKDRVVLGWSGPVQEPMSERVAAALDRYKTDRRRLVLILNSPGGSVEHGRKVVGAIHARDRAIDTFVQKAGVCASMCVPIFLAGRERMADPEAYFMFHQVSLGGSARENTKRRVLSESEKAFLSETAKTIEARATDAFFRSDIGIRGVNVAWLARMREKISGRDIWMSGQQLVDEGSGIVDRLIRTPDR